MKKISIPNIGIIHIKNQMLNEIEAFFKSNPDLIITVGNCELYYGESFNAINYKGVLFSENNILLVGYKDLCINDLEFVCEQINQYIETSFLKKKKKKKKILGN